MLALADIEIKSSAIHNNKNFGDKYENFRRRGSGGGGGRIPMLAADFRDTPRSN